MTSLRVRVKFVRALFPSLARWIWSWRGECALPWRARLWPSIPTAQSAPDRAALVSKFPHPLPRLRVGGRPALRRAGRPCATSSADAGEAGTQAPHSIALPPISVFNDVFDPGSTTTALGDYGPGVYRRWMHAGIAQEDSETSKTRRLNSPLLKGSSKACTLQ